MTSIRQSFRGTQSRVGFGNCKLPCVVPVLETRSVWTQQSKYRFFTFSSHISKLMYFPTHRVVWKSGRLQTECFPISVSSSNFTHPTFVRESCYMHCDKLNLRNCLVFCNSDSCNPVKGCDAQSMLLSSCLILLDDSAWLTALRPMTPPSPARRPAVTCSSFCCVGCVFRCHCA